MTHFAEQLTVVCTYIKRKQLTSYEIISSERSINLTINSLLLLSLWKGPIIKWPTQNVQISSLLTTHALLRERMLSTQSLARVSWPSVRCFDQESQRSDIEMQCFFQRVNWFATTCPPASN